MISCCLSNERLQVDEPAFLSLKVENQSREYHLKHIRIIQILPVAMAIQNIDDYDYVSVEQKGIESIVTIEIDTITAKNSFFEEMFFEIFSQQSLHLRIRNLKIERSKSIIFFSF